MATEQTARTRAHATFANFTAIPTERLMLRPLSLDDADALFEAIKNPRVAGWVATFPTPLTLSDVRKWILARIDIMDRAEGLYLGVFYAATSTLMGYMGMRLVDNKDDTVEIGGCLSELYWGKGFPEEVLRPIMNLLFKQLGFSVIEATTAPKNVASMRLLEMMNFTFIEEREFKFHDGSMRRSRVYHLTPALWAARKFIGIDQSQFTAEELLARRRQLIQLCQDLNGLRE